MKAVVHAHASGAAAAVAGAPSPQLWWVPLAGAAATLLAVSITVAWSAYMMSRQEALKRKATAYQLLGAIAVVRSRLISIQNEKKEPSDGYAAFERLLKIAYSGEAASLMAGKATIGAFFADLGGLEEELGLMRSAFARARASGGEGHTSTAAQRRIDQEIRDSLAAAGRATGYLDSMRAHCGGAPEPQRGEQTPASRNSP